MNPNRAADPGLVYDMGTEDYIHYLCASQATTLPFFSSQNNPFAALPQLIQFLT